MPYARYETWFAIVVLVCLDYMSSELQFCSGAIKEFIFGLWKDQNLVNLMCVV